MVLYLAMLFLLVLLMYLTRLGQTLIAGGALSWTGVVGHPIGDHVMIEVGRSSKYLPGRGASLEPSANEKCVFLSPSIYLRGPGVLTFLFIPTI